jgi:hypothetical protein
VLARSVRVTNLDAFRIWKGTEGLDLDWLLTRLQDKTEPSDAMKAGTALHKGLEEACEMEVGTLAVGDYRFDFNCECRIVLPAIRECELNKQYGDIAVVGHADGQIGNMIVDYKSTEQFDPERYMESYQWRFYLDMSDCDVFLYQIFVLREFGPPGCYEVRDTHQLKQYRYPDLHRDCDRLVNEYRAVMGNLLEVAA